MATVRKNFISTTRDTFRLLGKKERIHGTWNILLSIAQALLEVISISLVIPVLFQQFGPENETAKVMRRFIGTADWEILLVAIILIFVMKNVASFWIMKKQASFLNELYLKLAESVFRNFYRMSLAEQVHENSSERFRQIKTSAYDFAHFVLNSYLLLAADIVISISMTAVLLWFDYRIVFVLVVLCMPILAFYYFFRKKVIRKLDRSFRKLTPEANIVLSQGIQSFAETKIYRKENYFIHRFSKIMRITNGHLSDLKTYSNLPNRIFETVAILAFALLFAYSKTTGPAQQDIILVIALFSMALYKIVPSITRIFINFSNIQTYSYSVSELNENTANGDLAKTDPVKPFSFTEEIVLDHLHFSYPGNQNFPVIADLSLTVRKGEFILLEGSSGAGKTTLIYLLAGLLVPTRGQIRIDGSSIQASSGIASWQQNISLVTQTPLVLQDTVIHNVAFGLPDSEIDLAKVKRLILMMGLKELIESLPESYESMIGENGLTLSGGQRQRLVLARALYRNPSVLLLDEVTNQLDHQNKILILECLRELCRGGTTIIFASHDPVVSSYSTGTYYVRDSTLYKKESLPL